MKNGYLYTSPNVWKLAKLLQELWGSGEARHRARELFGKCRHYDFLVLELDNVYLDERN